MPVNDWPPISAASMVARAVSPTSAATSTKLAAATMHDLPPSRRRQQRRQFGMRRTNGERQRQTAVQRMRRSIKQEQVR
jgi:hypothetical protein